MSRTKKDKKLSTERMLIAAIRDKIDALAHAQFCKTRINLEKHQRNTYAQMTSAERRSARKFKTQMIKNEIHLLLCANGLIPHHHPPQIPKATPEESQAIRFEFDGIMHRPENNQLSEAYLAAKQAPYEYEAKFGFMPSSPYQPQDYNLSTSPIWQRLQMLPNFRQTRKKIVNQLCKTSIPPQTVTEMNYYDFLDALITNCKENRTKPFEGRRQKNIKMFAACYGQEFTRVMTSLRYKEEEVKKMLQLMREGHSPNILDMHHKTNVTNFKELEKPEEINAFPNMLYTFVHPHHRFLHFGKGYDIDKNIVFFGGFDPAYQIKRNPEKERQYLLKTGQLNKNEKTH